MPHCKTFKMIALYWAYMDNASESLQNFCNDEITAEICIYIIICNLKHCIEMRNLFEIPAKLPPLGMALPLLSRPRISGRANTHRTAEGGAHVGPRSSAGEVKGKEENQPSAVCR